MIRQFVIKLQMAEKNWDLISRILDILYAALPRIFNQSVCDTFIDSGALRVLMGNSQEKKFTQVSLLNYCFIFL